MSQKSKLWFSAVFGHVAEVPTLFKRKIPLRFKILYQHTAKVTTDVQI